jgi:hypothetical protein
MRTRPGRLLALRRLRVRAREGASAELGRTREALAVAEAGARLAQQRVSALAERTRAARVRLASLSEGDPVGRWAGEDAWARRLGQERTWLEELAETLRRCMARRETSVDAARQALVAGHRSVEALDRLALRREAALRRRQAQRDEA